MKTEYAVFDVMNTSGKRVGFGISKTVDGVDVTDRARVWDTMYNKYDEAEAARKYVACGAKLSDFYATATEEERETVKILWTLSEDHLRAISADYTGGLLYAARYIWFDRFGRFGRMKTDKFYAKYVAGSEDPVTLEAVVARIDAVRVELDTTIRAHGNPTELVKELQRLSDTFRRLMDEATPLSGEDFGDSRGDVALCRGCRIEVSPGNGYCSLCYGRAFQAANIVSENGKERCGRCNGTGIYTGAGYVENGVFKGYSGTCFRCKGAGHCTPVQNIVGTIGQEERAAREFMNDVNRASRQSCECRFYSRGVEIDGPNGADFSTSDGCPIHDPEYEADEDDAYEAYRNDVYDSKHFGDEPGYGN